MSDESGNLIDGNYDYRKNKLDKNLELRAESLYSYPRIQMQTTSVCNQGKRVSARYHWLDRR